MVSLATAQRPRIASEARFSDQPGEGNHRQREIQKVKQGNRCI